MGQIAIRVSNVRKSFEMPEHKVTSLKQAFVSIGSKAAARRQEVLNGVSFEVEKGDFFGVVGKNGSGKSTLLKMLAGVYSVDSGSIQIEGQVTPFIELGVGFNPELSGRDNVYLSASLLGYGRSVVDTMYDSIVQFAELEEHMDKKLKNYSSGMQVRLAFSIAVMAKNDILIFDEVLAVGDEAFQQKCTDIFESYKAAGQTIVLVTHDMASVKKFCNKAILIDRGKIIASGNPYKVADEYSRLNNESTGETMDRKQAGSEPSLITVNIKNAKGRKANIFKVRDKATIHIDWPKGLTDRAESIGVTLVKNTGEHVSGINSRVGGKGVEGWQAQDGIMYELSLDVYPGKYHLIVEVFDSPGNVSHALYDGPELLVEAHGDVSWSGLVQLDYEWKRKYD